MIKIVNKVDCCGCSACVQACPVKCMLLSEDNEGFLYPKADVSVCINCGLCEKVCPVINQNKPRMPLEALAAINPDERIRAASSSGGVFTILAEKMIEEGGVVFGVRFDDEWQAVLDSSETKDGISAFRGSKYMQARIGDGYICCKKYLQEGRKVLFTGTPCQIAGLNRYLHKDYSNLVTCDIICHGVPSPGVWKRYLDEVVTAEKFAIRNVEFRNKRKGWKKFGFVLDYSEDRNVFSLESVHFKNSYMRAFLSNLILRPSCYQCPAKCGKSYADVTIADFWGIEHVNPSMFDDRGTSLILINTEKGKNALPLQSLKYSVEDGTKSVKYNSAYYYSAIPHPRRQAFFTSLNAGTSVHKAIVDSLRLTFWQFIINTVKRPIKNIYRKLKYRSTGLEIGGVICTTPLIDTDVTIHDTSMLHIRDITFRRKSKSWKRYSVCIELR